MKYEEYKDSGMSWVGDVPINWQRKRIKFLCSNSSAGIWGEEEKGDVNDIVCFRIADFDYQRGYLCFDKLTFRNIQSKDLNGRTLTENSLLIEKSGGGEVTPVGRVVRYNYGDKATCSNFIHFITINKLYNRDFLYYYFYALYANKENLLYFNQTTGIQNLKIGEYLGQSIFLPSFTEQQAIATYLDKKCGEINHAIDVQKKKIDLLGELKQTIITDAVTKGLNPNAPMKDSGMEWIGQVPSHWLVCKLKNYSKIILGKMLMSNPPKGEEKKYTLEKYLKSKNVGWLQVYDNYDEVEEMWFNKYEKSIYRLQINDLVMNEGGDIGKIGLWNNTEYSCYIQNSINKISVIGNLSPFYLQYLLFAIAKTNYFWSIVNPISIAHLTKEKLSNTPILVPSFSEQQAIVKFLDEECAKIEAKISKANRRIELLEELKQSIITEAVTGKIKVC